MFDKIEDFIRSQFGPSTHEVGDSKFFILESGSIFGLRFGDAGEVRTIYQDVYAHAKETLERQIADKQVEAERLWRVFRQIDPDDLASVARARDEVKTANDGIAALQARLVPLHERMASVTEEPTSYFWRIRETRTCLGGWDGASEGGRLAESVQIDQA